ncbi:uncharacterized protein LOC123320622 [Coccinella septempunctata]|uniref:uncharacterized protein LOC123320622 n=1 Tax=Coccinella septempunctata TaxID=41139 RepID=UPI001D06B937|nr:uncharacterized protein LOC123320622 [Coccinella septempunctata]
MSLNPISRQISTIEEISEDTRSSSTVNTEPTVLDISDYRLNYVESPGAIPESEMSEKSRKQNVENCHNCCHNSDVIIKLLTELTLKVDELKETIGANGQISLNSEAVNFITSKLPCKNIEELEFKYFLIYIMTSIGGTTGRDFTQRVLKKLLTNAVAELCSWRGAKHNFELQKLKIFECAYTSVIKHFAITRKEFEMHVKDWLRHARQRREREHTKKNILTGPSSHSGSGI